MKDYVVALTKYGSKELIYVTEQDLKDFPNIEFSWIKLFKQCFIINPDKVDIWNKFILCKWQCLDDTSHYHYEQPVLSKDKCGIWLRYDLHGGICTPEEYIRQLTEEVRFAEYDFRCLKKFLKGVNF